MQTYFFFFLSVSNHLKKILFKKLHSGLNDFEILNTFNYLITSLRAEVRDRAIAEIYTLH